MAKQMASGKLQFIIVCIFSLAVTFYCQYQALFNKYIFHEDLRGNIFWMERARNANAFGNDLFAGISTFFASPLIRLFYKIMFFVDLQLLSELLAFPLCLLSAIYIFKLGNKIAGKYCAFFAGIIFVLSAWHTTDWNFFGVGNAVDFAIPLGIMFLYYFFVGNIVAMAPILILQSFLYPPLFLICIACFTVSIFSKITVKRAMIFFFVILAAFSVLLNNYLKVQMRDLGQVYTMQEIQSADIFKKPSELPLMYPTAFERIFNNNSGIGGLEDRLGILLALAFVSIVFSIKKIKYLLPVRITFFLFSSSLLFILANILMLRLFQPFRYLALSLPVVLIIIISIFLSRLIESVSTNKRKFAFSILLLVVLCFLFSPSTKTAYIKIKNVKFYNFIEKLPDDSLIAGHPYLMDNVPLLTKKKVFLMAVWSIPFYKKFYEQIESRTFDFFKAYYSESFSAFLDFCKRNNVNYFVVRKQDFSENLLKRGKIYHFPYDKLVVNLIDKRKNFALTKIPSDIISYEDEEYAVIKINQKP